MRKTVLLAIVLVTILLMPTAASAGLLSWQLGPVLGVDTVYNGDVLVRTNTGWVNVPHYYDVSSPDYLVGNLTMNVFAADGTGTAKVVTGSGIYLDPNQDWSYDAWFVNDLAPTVRVWEEQYGEAAGDAYIMNQSYVGLQRFGYGHWTYHENWTQGLDTIVSATPFEVPVPEPATLTLLGLGLAGVARAARRRKK